MQSAFTPFVACCRQNYGELQGAVDNRKTSCLSKVLEDGRLGPSAKAIAAGKRKRGARQGRKHRSRYLCMQRVACALSLPFQCLSFLMLG
jgi:hypothetical protein